MLKVGIIGAGLIGGKRAAALGAEDKVVAVADIRQELAADLAKKHSAVATTQWEEVVNRKDVDAVIVSTPNLNIPAIAIAALKKDKCVLVEKPAGRNPEEIQELAKVADKSKGCLVVGFNHRFHPAFQRSKMLLKEKTIGDLMYIRARYGHGGRLGYEKEWRADPKISGGGELLDQGVHLIDLTRWLCGEFDLKWGHTGTYFWDMPVEDNGFLCLESKDKKSLAWLHASCTEWKNLFDFEIFGKTGKIQISGLGRSYGIEELKVFRMKPEMGPPEILIETFPGEDKSWNEEWLAFKKEIRKETTHIAKIHDALRAVEIVYSAYKMNA